VDAAKVEIHDLDQKSDEEGTRERDKNKWKKEQIPIRNKAVFKAEHH